jgi:hypothetical protein
MFVKVVSRKQKARSARAVRASDGRKTLRDPRLRIGVVQKSNRLCHLSLRPHHVAVQVGAHFIEARLLVKHNLLRSTSPAHGELDLHEDHYVRKIAHLLYVPNTQSMLARNRARA